MQKFHGMLSIGLLTSKINLEGPIIKGKTSFNLSARRSYLDLLAKPFMPKNDKSSYYFYDINAKINHKFSDRSRLFLSAYNGKDHFGNKITEYSGYENKSKMDWGNTIISARWNFIFNNKLFSNTTVAFNKYSFMPYTYTYSQHTDITTHQAKPPINILLTTAPVFRTGVIRWTLTTTPHPHIALSLVRNICITAFGRKS